MTYVDNHGLEPVLSVKDLAYTYPSGTQALGSVSLEMNPGEMLGIVGPSGCGKSTLLQVIAGFEEPTSGHVTHAEADGDRLPMSMVFQKDTALPWLTVEQNVGLAFRYSRRSVSKRDRREEIDGLLEMAGLADVRKQYPYQLSGGMRRRVSFSSSVAARPQLLLLDEPFSALDEPTKVGIHQSIHEIMETLGICGIIVTHDIQEAISLCDEVVVLTRRPAVVASRERIPFGKSRTMLELRERPDFLKIYGHLWHDLSAQIKAGDSAEEEQ